MSLCDICRSIPFENLPPFQTDDYLRGLTGLQHVHNLTIKRGISQDDVTDASRVRHHANMASLRQAAAEGCELCALILVQADALLAEVETVQSSQRREEYSPMFDMWLSRRDDGGQGFYVMSNSRSDHRKQIVPVAAFAFVVHDSDSLSTIIRGRPITQNLNADVLQRLVKWNADCEQYHQCCQDAGTTPQYLIDVQSCSCGGTVKIVELDADVRHRYTALSYTSEPEVIDYWSQNGLQRNAEVGIESLPKMFQDAILVTRTLGVHYVWIDSLCIPNDSWARDSEQAGSVYENAYLTLSATGSKNISDGLLFQRPVRTLVKIPYGSDNEGSRSVSASSLPLDKEMIRIKYREMKEEPLFQDVWPFQERVLSRRTVHFASDQMYFECLHHFASEDGLLERMRYQTPVDKLPEGTEHSRRVCLDEDPGSRWCAMAWDYGRYSSNGRADKLRALANVARAFQRLDNDEYIVGHWKKSLPDSLCWQSLRCKPSGERGVPSWSWLSVDGIPSMGLGYRRVHDYLAEIIDIRVTLADNASPFGNVTEAEIELEAPLVPLRLLEKPPGPTASDHMFVVAVDDDDRGFYAGFDTLNREFSVSAEAVRKMQLWALILMATHQEDHPYACSSGSSICALIVTAADESGKKMKRLGFLAAATDRLPYDKLGSRKTVILV